MAGVVPVLIVRHGRPRVYEVGTVSFLEEIGNEICFVGMMESGDAELELVSELEKVFG